MRLVPLAAAALVAALAALPPTAEAQRRRAPAPPRLTEENLVPTELFVEADQKRFGYPLGFEVHYTKSETGHHWKLNETSHSAEPAAPAGEAGASAAPARETLPPSPEEDDWTQHVALVRPTFVTIVFAGSPEAARAMVDAVEEAHKDREALAEKTKLAVLKLDREPRIAPGALVYNREFNLGERTGGVRRASAVVASKGNIFLRVDAAWGLKDGAYEAQEETLEKRAREVAAYLLRKM